MASANPFPDRVPSKVVRPRREAPLELPDGPAVVEAGLVKWIAPAFAQLERLVSLDPLPQCPFTDESGILPVSDSAFVEIGAAGRRRMESIH
jgi:hypothetical protein